MESKVGKSGFTPYVGEGILSPNRQLVTDLVKGIVTEHPSFARAIQKRCLGPSGKMALPVMFLSSYLIGSKGHVILEDDKGLTWKVDWIAYMQSGRRLALTVGWPEYISYHNVRDGDVFLVEIVSPEHFKVQVIPTDISYNSRKYLQRDHASAGPADTFSARGTSLQATRIKDDMGPPSISDITRASNMREQSIFLPPVTVLSAVP